jgi:hypothetical protein
MTKSTFSLYTDEPVIGMDHPLFMAKTQTKIYAILDARYGIPLEDALRTIPEQIHALFGDVPQSLITAEISMAYATVAAEKVA